MKERIGTKVKNLRQEKLMTQSELAGEKITRSMLSLIEHGNSEPSLSSLKYLAERLHVSPAYLVADENEDDMYRREMKIGDIRLAYGTGEYRICLDLCRSVGLEADDELNLIAADCAIALAVERIGEGDLHGVGECLELAAAYADATRYRASHIYAEASVLSRYLTRFSEAFYTENEELAKEKGVPLCAAACDPFCSYALILSKLEQADIPPEELRRETEDARVALQVSAPLLALHIDELLLVREGDMEGALETIRTMLGAGERLPVPLLYELFRDREICARETGDYKGAYESASAKHEFLSKLLSES